MKSTACRTLLRVLILLGRDKLKTTQTGGFEFVAHPGGRFPNRVSRKIAEFCGKLELGFAHGGIIIILLPVYYKYPMPNH